MFRINIYLNIKDYFKGIFLKFDSSSINNNIKKILQKQSQKKHVEFTSQCRIAFLYILKFMKKEDPEKNEVIFSSYNLPEMINVAKNLKYKIKFCDLNKNTGNMDEKILERLISKKTKAIILTNIYNDSIHSKKIRKIAQRFKIKLIEDNAIYFDNFNQNRKKKIYSGYFGDYTIYSYNIMKNISALYGGAVATNDFNFINYLKKENNKNKNFFLSKILHQSSIFFILKIMSIKFLYNLIFIHIIRKVHKNKFKPILKIFYPSIKFEIINFPKYYFTKISNFSLKLIYLQLINVRKRKDNFISRKNKNKFYQKELSKINSKNIQLLPIKDYNYQNFLEFPILVENKSKLNNYLLNNKIETKYINYKNCEKIFGNRQKIKCKNSEFFEKHLLGLPNHEKITFNYIRKIKRLIQSNLKSEK